MIFYPGGMNAEGGTQVLQATPVQPAAAVTGGTSSICVCMCFPSSVTENNWFWWTKKRCEKLASSTV